LRRAADFRDYQPWGGWTGGPIGTITDDTQMTMCVAESLIASGGRLDPHDLARRFLDWLPVGRGVGQTCVEAVRRLERGEPWWRAGVPSAGNGAAMRVAPIGIALGHDPASMCHDAVISAVITHADPMAAASAVGHAWLVARLAASDATRIDPGELVQDLVLAMQVIDDPGAVEREWQTRAGKTDARVRLADRVAEIPTLMDEPTEEVLDHLFNGAFVLESFPAALWFFLRHLHDPQEGVIAAVLGGRDADTIASMVACWFGTLYGVEAFPDRWLGDSLEFSDELTAMADQLAALPPTPP
jgi:ADP-ribosylglycohydrolase